MAKVIELTRSILVSVVIIHVLIHEFCVEGRSITETVKKTNPNQAIIKTIQGEDGEIIDCFDIYKQPAFDHPLLRNHTLQMRPSSYPKGMKVDDFESEIIQQTWHKNGECPVGTIPINRRGRKNYTSFLHKPDRKPHRKTHNLTIFKNDQPFETAFVRSEDNKFYGAQAKINGWKPTLGSPLESSSSQMWVEWRYTGEVIEAGLQVDPVLYGDNDARFFVAWHNEDGKGCVNLLCPGFVQTNRQFSFNFLMRPISVYNGSQFETPIAIFKDENNGNWWVKLQGNIIGYWPGELFLYLSQGANSVKWGGFIRDERIGGPHTTTQMGSGHFASEGFGKAAFIRNLGIIDETHTLKEPEKKNLVTWSTNSNCYDVLIASDKEPNTIYYGGPGFSQKCP